MHDSTLSQISWCWFTQMPWSEILALRPEYHNKSWACQALRLQTDFAVLHPLSRPKKVKRHRQMNRKKMIVATESDWWSMREAPDVQLITMLSAMFSGLHTRTINSSKNVNKHLVVHPAYRVRAHTGPHSNQLNNAEKHEIHIVDTVRQHIKCVRCMP